MQVLWHDRGVFTKPACGSDVPTTIATGNSKKRNKSLANRQVNVKLSSKHVHIQALAQRSPKYPLSLSHNMGWCSQCPHWNGGASSCYTTVTTIPSSSPVRTQEYLLCLCVLWDYAHTLWPAIHFSVNFHRNRPKQTMKRNFKQKQNPKYRYQQRYQQSMRSCATLSDFPGVSQYPVPTCSMPS